MRPLSELLLERENGIEPSLLAWKARVLPLNYSRKKINIKSHSLYQKIAPKAKELSLLGMNQAQIAQALSVSRRTVQLALTHTCHPRMFKK